MRMLGQGLDCGLAVSAPRRSEYPHCVGSGSHVGSADKHHCWPTHSSTLQSSLMHPSHVRRRPIVDSHHATDHICTSVLVPPGLGTSARHPAVNTPLHPVILPHMHAASRQAQIVQAQPLVVPPVIAELECGEGRGGSCCCATAPKERCVRRPVGPRPAEGVQGR